MIKNLKSNASLEKDSHKQMLKNPHRHFFFKLSIMYEQIIKEGHVSLLQTGFY